LTDWLLYNRSKECPNIHYHTFSRNEESLLGADWEWWVLLSDKHCPLFAYRFLVQAKKLHHKPEADNYALLSYGNRNGLQMDLLLDSANERSVFPLYLFYSISQKYRLTNFKAIR